VAQADTLRSRPDLKLLFGFGETRREGGPYLRKIILANVPLLAQSGHPTAAEELYRFFESGPEGVLLAFTDREGTR
jgi:hypothetical protein